MSFVKIPRKYPAKPQHGSRTGKLKKKRPAWDDTVNDLSVHRASAEELIRRKVVTTSHNLDAVKEDQMRQRISKAREHSRAKPGQNAFLKEVLYDNSQLHEVLAKSDRMMAVVKDLFGDDPMKYRGAPCVTLAPEQSAVNGLLPNMELGPSKLDILSDSVMDKTALNEEDEESPEAQYESAMDLERFQRLLELASEEERRRELEQQEPERERLTRSTADSLLHQLATKLGLGPDDDEAEKTLEEDSPPPRHGNNAINDTMKVKRTRARVTEEERAASPPTPVMPPSNACSDMNALRQVLDGLENNIGEYEKMIGREPTLVSSGEDSLSGFTSRLVNAVNKITRYMRENEIRLRAESTVREQLHQDVLFLRQLVDTLTNDILVTQEQYATLQAEFVKYKTQTAEEIMNIKQALEAAGIQLHKTVMPTPQLPQPAFPAQQLPAYPADQQPSRPLPTPQQNAPIGEVTRTHGSVAGPGMVTGTQHHSMSQAAVVANSGAVFSREQFQQPSLQQQQQRSSQQHSVQQHQVAAGFSTAQMNELSGDPLPQRNLPQNRSMAVPLNVPKQTQSPRLPEKRSHQTIPLYPGSVQPSAMLRQPVFSREPVRATSYRSNSGLQPTNPDDIPGSKQPLSGVSADIGVREAPHLESTQVRGLQDSVLQLKQAIDQEEVSLEQQILALQKQHVDAQNKLHLLMQQGQAVDQTTTAMKAHMAVSPPISPITVSSEGEGHGHVGQKVGQAPHATLQQRHVLSHTKEIKVSLPRVDLNASGEQA